MGFILLLVVAGIVLNVLFWGFIAYLVIKLFGNASPQQLGQVAKCLHAGRRQRAQYGGTERY